MYRCTDGREIWHGGVDQNLVAMATSVSSCNQKMSASDFPILPNTKTPVISNHIVHISHRNALIAILVQNWLPW